MKIVMFKRKHACFSYICYFLTIFRSSGSECKSFEPYPVRKKMKSVNITSFWFYYGNFLFVLWMNIVVYDIIFHWINKSVLQFNSLISEMSEMLQLWKWHIYKKREFSLMKQKYFTTHTSKWQKFLIFFYMPIVRLGCQGTHGFAKLVRMQSPRWLTWHSFLLEIHTSVKTPTV